MKILNVETVKDTEMGWCYIVTTIPSSGSSTETIYVVLKPVFDRKNTRLFPRNANLLENGRWEKLFNYSFNPHYDTKREYLKAMASFQIRINDWYHVAKQPQEVKKNAPIRMFGILNSKGIDV